MAQTKNDFYYTTLKLPKKWREDLKLIAVKENKTLNDVMAEFINVGYLYYSRKNGKPQLKIEQLKIEQINKQSASDDVAIDDNKTV